jgi:serine O-acetyltransferase
MRRYIPARKKLSPLRVLRLLLQYQGLQALLGYRLGQALQRAPWYWQPLLSPAWLFYFLLSRYVWLAFDIRLKLSASIGTSLYIGHFGGILLERCRIGAGCAIFQSVHIHPVAAGEAGPVLGEQVWVGAHAQIIGNHQIGAGSTISAGAVVQRDIPAQSLCLGNPARVVMSSYDNRVILRLDGSPE